MSISAKPPIMRCGAPASPEDMRRVKLFRLQKPRLFQPVLTVPSRQRTIFGHDEQSGHDRNHNGNKRTRGLLSFYKHQHSYPACTGHPRRLEDVISRFGVEKHPAAHLLLDLELVT